MSTDDRFEDTETAELLRRLTDQTATLIRQEMELARAEMLDAEARGAAEAPRRPAGPAALLGLCAAGSFVAAIILALATVVEAWVAALVVAVALTLLSALAVSASRRGERGVPATAERHREVGLTPAETAELEYEPPPQYPSDVDEGVIQAWEGNERPDG